MLLYSFLIFYDFDLFKRCCKNGKNDYDKGNETLRSHI